jgi:hypothetical protein
MDYTNVPCGCGAALANDGRAHAQDCAKGWAIQAVRLEALYHRAEASIDRKKALIAATDDRFLKVAVALHAFLDADSDLLPSRVRRLIQLARGALYDTKAPVNKIGEIIMAARALVDAHDEGEKKLIAAHGTTQDAVREAYAWAWGFQAPCVDELRKLLQKEPET